MAHLRMPIKMVLERGGKVASRAGRTNAAHPQHGGGNARDYMKRETAGYLFTLIEWEAIAYLSVGQTTVIDFEEFVRSEVLNHRFPRTVVGQVVYGGRLGLAYSIRQFKFADGSLAGATLMMRAGDKVLGYYAVQYQREQ